MTHWLRTESGALKGDFFELILSHRQRKMFKFPRIKFEKTLEHLTSGKKYSLKDLKISSEKKNDKFKLNKIHLKPKEGMRFEVGRIKDLSLTHSKSFYFQ